MTPESLQELQQLLCRIEAAGGPVEVIPAEPEVGLMSGGWRLGLLDSSYYALNWQAEEQAILIHALKLDMRERGYQGAECRVRESSSGIISYGVTAHWSIKIAYHENEVIAWALAWLAAFGPDQLVPNGSAE